MRPDRLARGELAARTCERYLAAIAAGASPSEVVAELAEAHDVQRPAIWRRLRAGGAIPPCQGIKRIANNIVRPKPASAAPKPEQYVDRDPCFFCGVRGDVGCQHRRWAA